MNTITLTADGVNLSAVVTEITLEDATDTLGASLSFKIPWGDTLSYSGSVPTLGAQIALYEDGTSVFAGVVTAEEIAEQSRSYTAHDFCWYLNKSKITVQFAAITVAQAIYATLDEVGVQVRVNPDMYAQVEETCYCEAPSTILSRLLERQSDNDGEEYHIYASKTMENMLIVERLGSITPPHMTLAEITSPQNSKSLEDVVNRVEYVTGDSSGYTHTGIYAENADSVERYGMIQEIIIAGDEDKDAQTIVSTRVSRKSEPIPHVTVECAGNFSLRAGVKIPVYAPTVEASGDYIVERVRNEIREGEHRMSVTLRGISSARSYTESVNESVQKNALLILHNKEEERFHVRA